ncbi:hypothetical protein [Maricaulis alexandrii]|uniref:hypothetical protein n=1 Tax=Maricaulis alexandrii TaxID=2570354 RepID=UPI0011093EC7|nr:hypothetical protein [Maricaulis alexandrii]
MTDTNANETLTARPQDEMLPFLNNFHDIFTTIGVVILLAGLGAGAVQVLDGLALPEGEQGWQAVLMGLIGGIAVIIWALSALLVGKQRRILPGIVLSGAFAVASAIVLVWAYVQFLIHGVGITEASLEAAVAPVDDMEFGRDAVMALANALPVWVRILPMVAALAALAPMIAYYLNFRLPFAGGLTGVGLVGLVVATLFTIDPYTTIVWMPAVNVVAGAALLLAGIIFDSRDPDRNTRISGTAFWLHFFAAPMLLTAVLNVTQLGWTFSEADFANPEAFSLLSAMATNSAEATGLAAIALAVIGVFALISLLINRRALIVSGLLTAGIAISVLVSASGLGVGAVVAVTLLVLGAVVVLLGAAWNPVRKILLTPLPSEGPLARIFPPANGAVG